MQYIMSSWATCWKIGVFWENIFDRWNRLFFYSESIIFYNYILCPGQLLALVRIGDRIFFFVRYVYANGFASVSISTVLNNSISWAFFCSLKTPLNDAAMWSSMEIISRLTWWLKRYSTQNGIMRLTGYSQYHMYYIVGIYCCSAMQNTH